MNDNKIIYIASPYAGDIEQNTDFARKACRYCIGQGHTPIAPHLMYTNGILNDENPEDRKLGLEHGRNLIGVCDELWVCGDRISQGMNGEIQLAKQLGIPIEYVDACQISEEYPLYEPQSCRGFMEMM